uniref:Uncharacterized protein n=1 Tax=Caenorhabditis japonica TaxID=281687 RepID=A0A8R1ICP2_CAEJA
MNHGPLLIHRIGVETMVIPRQPQHYHHDATTRNKTSTSLFPAHIYFQTNTNAGLKSTSVFFACMLASIVFFREKVCTLFT